MIEADRKDIWMFKERYCRNRDARRKMLHEFQVTLEEREELIPGKKVISYALDERYIENELDIFKVVDPLEHKIYYPLFSKEKMLEITEFTGTEIPAVRSIFIHRDTERMEWRKACYDNLQLRRMILYIRSLMILHIDKPKPMGGAMKSIFEKMSLHPNWEVRASEIKSINTALGSYLKKDVNVQNEHFSNLQEYIVYVREYTGGNVKETDFRGLKHIFQQKYTDEQIYF